MTEETTVNSLTVGSHSDCEVCKELGQRESKYRLLGAKIRYGIYGCKKISRNENGKNSSREMCLLSLSCVYQIIKYQSSA